MSATILALATVAILVVIAVFADRRYRAIPNTPVQWGPAGVNLSAPRRVGLAIIPLLVTGIVLFVPLSDRFGLPLNTTVTFGVAVTSTVGLAVQAVQPRS